MNNAVSRIIGRVQDSFLLLRYAEHIEESSYDSSNDLPQIIWPKKYSWESAPKWFNTLIPGLKELTSFEYADIDQPKGPLVRFLARQNNNTVTIIADYSDYERIYDDVLNVCDLYFKFQFSLNGYESLKVRPGGYPPNDPLIYQVKNSLHSSRKKAAFNCDVYARFGRSFAYETRKSCLDRLSSLSGIKFRGGFDKVRYLRFLEESAHSRICIDLPGNGPICFRFVDYLALGCFVIAYPSAVTAHPGLKAGEHFVVMSKDMSDLEELVKYYLRRSEERERIADNAFKFFTENLTPRPLAAYYMKEISEIILTDGGSKPHI